MRAARRTPLIALLAATALALSACGDDGEVVTVGSANFPESILMGNLYAGALEDAGFDVTEQFNIGARDAYMPALEDGEIDVLPEYLGSLHSWATEGDDATTDTDQLLSELNEHYDPELLLLEPAEAENANALLVTQETADEYGLTTLSDLGEVADELVAGGPPEVRDRHDGLPGLQEVYGIEFAEFRNLDACGPVTIAALADGDIDVARACSAMGVIAEEGWVILEDDQGFHSPEHLTPVVRSDVHNDELEQALNAVSAALTTDELIEMNYRVEIDNDDANLVAQDWLEEQGIVD